MSKIVLGVLVASIAALAMGTDMTMTSHGKVIQREENTRDGAGQAKDHVFDHKIHMDVSNDATHQDAVCDSINGVSFQEKGEEEYGEETDEVFAMDIFQEFDFNADGFLEPSELNDIMVINTGAWEEYDTEGEEPGKPDGRLSLAEFMRAMKASTPEKQANEENREHIPVLDAVSSYLKGQLVEDTDEDENADP